MALGVVALEVARREGVGTGGAVARVSSSPIEMMVTTDSILATEAVRVAQNIRQITIASLVAEPEARGSSWRVAWGLQDEFDVGSTGMPGI